MAALIWIARLSRSDALMPHYLGINAYRACSEKPGARFDEPRTKRRSTGTGCRERCGERERDSLARSLSYLFSWREMLSYLPYLTVPYRRYCPKPTRSQDIERHDAFLAYAAGGAPPPLTRSQTRLNDVHLPRHSTAPSNCLIRLRRSFLLPGTSYLLPPTNNRLLHHSTLVCPPMTARERTVRKLPLVPYLLDFHSIHPSSSGTTPGAARAGTPLQASQPFVPPLT